MGSNGMQSSTRWVHTGVEAPYSFTITGFKQLMTGRGVAYSAELVHPELGVVGLISNEGNGGPTVFDSYDHTLFGSRCWEQFLQRSLRDGEPMDTGFTGLENLLDDIIEEAETAGLVEEMRAKHQFLVRSYLPREAAGRGAQRGVPLAYTRILTRRVDRERLLAQLADDPAERLDEGAYWQMFTGEDWVRMPGTSRLTHEQVGTRLRRVDELLTGPDAWDFHITAVPFDDEFFLYGIPNKRFTLVGDKVAAVNTDSWCDCRRRQKIVAFEQWNDRSLQVSGTVHAAQRCRRLVRID